MSWAAKMSLCYIVQPGILFWLEMCNLVMKIIMNVCPGLGIIPIPVLGIRKQYQPQA